MGMTLKITYTKIRSPTIAVKMTKVPFGSPRDIASPISSPFKENFPFKKYPIIQVAKLANCQSQNNDRNIQNH